MKLEVLSNALIIALIIRISSLHGRLLRIRWKTITNLQLRQFGASIQSRINRFTVEIGLCKSLICDMNHKSIYNIMRCKIFFKCYTSLLRQLWKSIRKQELLSLKYVKLWEREFLSTLYIYIIHDIVIITSSMFIYGCMNLFCILSFYMILLYISFLFKYTFYILLTLEICEYLMYSLFMVFSLRDL